MGDDHVFGQILNNWGTSRCGCVMMERKSSSLSSARPCDNPHRLPLTARRRARRRTHRQTLSLSPPKESVEEPPPRYAVLPSRCFSLLSSPAPAHGYAHEITEPRPAAPARPRQPSRESEAKVESRKPSRRRSKQDSGLVSISLVRRVLFRIR